jgi:hypothetical protein
MMGGHVARMGVSGMVYKPVVRKPEGNTSDTEADMGF